MHNTTHPIRILELSLSLSNSKKEKGMDSWTALELVKQGGTLLLLDVPEYTLLGIDTQVY
jgi:hypothetical protein